jgi:CHRD domain-containing protein
MLKWIGVTLVAAFGLSSLPLGATESKTYNLTANLKARSEVPKPVGVSPQAVGLFTGKAVKQTDGSLKITWRLTFSHLTGQATAAHIHLAKPGVAGPVAAALCGPCKSGQTGTAILTKAQFTTAQSGGAYANIHTDKNPGGEIRGQVKVSS